MAAAVVAILRLPLSAVVIATLLTTHAGNNIEPLIIVGTVVAYITTLLMSRPPKAPTEAAPQPASAAEPALSP
jgi:hypothetical protein